MGANCGLFLDICLKLQEKILGCNTDNLTRVEYHVFEPAKETFKALRNNIKNKNGIIFNQIALSDCVGEKTLYYDGLCSGLASLSKRKLDHFNIDFFESEKIFSETLDAYCKKTNVKKIDLLKMDVEGYEMSIVRGAHEMLLAKKIDRILFEFGGCNIDSRVFFQDFWYALSDLYRIYRITPTGKLFEIKKYTEECEQFRTTNFLAIRKDLLR